MRDKFDLRKFISANQIAAIMIIIVVCMSLAYGIFFLPRMKELRVKYLECRLCESQVIDARNQVQAAFKLDKERGARVLISEKEAAGGIDEFTEHGKALGIKFISIKPGSIISPEGAPYKILPIEMEIEAKDDQFVKFMGSIDELKKAVVTVKSFDITPDKEDNKILKIDMVIEIYLSLKDEHAK
ncbi:MAG: type 4a pilus biogenesis protein PilO [Candidatus Omnitrophota bacterium]|nr:type 4a pilus biogenesis protein PilO [Candidatus Omnitrophota bacterium]